MSEDQPTYAIGDMLEITITGYIGNYGAEVIGFDASPDTCPILKVEEYPFPLKDGDYIIYGKLPK